MWVILTKACETVFQMYTALHERSDGIYRRAERLNDHIDKNIL